jgi:hypothetical protein
MRTRASAAAAVAALAALVAPIRTAQRVRKPPQEEGSGAKHPTGFAPHTRRPRTGFALLALAAIASLAALLSTTAAAAPTPADLAAHGWSCAPTPPFVIPPRIACGNPGTGRPFPGNPDPRPTYTLVTFTPSGDFLGTVHLVRADLYAGQPCTDGEPYVFRGLIGYYECLNLVGTGG